MKIDLESLPQFIKDEMTFRRESIKVPLDKMQRMSAPVAMGMG